MDLISQMPANRLVLGSSNRPKRAKENTQDAGSPDADQYTYKLDHVLFFPKGKEKIGTAEELEQDFTCRALDLYRFRPEADGQSLEIDDDKLTNLTQNPEFCKEALKQMDDEFIKNLDCKKLLVLAHDKASFQALVEQIKTEERRNIAWVHNNTAGYIDSNGKVHEYTGNAHQLRPEVIAKWGGEINSLVTINLANNWAEACDGLFLLTHPEKPKTLESQLSSARIKDLDNPQKYSCPLGYIDISDSIPRKQPISNLLGAINDNHSRMANVTDKTSTKANVSKIGAEPSGHTAGSNFSGFNIEQEGEGARREELAKSIDERFLQNSEFSGGDSMHTRIDRVLNAYMQDTYTAPPVSDAAMDEVKKLRKVIYAHDPAANAIELRKMLNWLSRKLNREESTILRFALAQHPQYLNGSQNDTEAQWQIKAALEKATIANAQGELKKIFGTKDGSGDHRQKIAKSLAPYLFNQQKAILDDKYLLDRFLHLVTGNKEGLEIHENDRRMFRTWLASTTQNQTTRRIRTRMAKLHGFGISDHDEIPAKRQEEIQEILNRAKILEELEKITTEDPELELRESEAVVDQAANQYGSSIDELYQMLNINPEAEIYEEGLKEIFSKLDEMGLKLNDEQLDLIKRESMFYQLFNWIYHRKELGGFDSFDLGGSKHLAISWGYHDLRVDLTTDPHADPTEHPPIATWGSKYSDVDRDWLMETA